MRFSVLYIIFVSVNSLITIPKKPLPSKLKLKNRQWWLKSLNVNKNKAMCILCKERPRKRLNCDECKIKIEKI